MSEIDDDPRVIDLNRDAPATVVPLDALSEDALRGLVESFVLREGTDYGAIERTHAQKIADVLRQLACGEALIEFDPQTESIDIVLALPEPRVRR